MIVAFDMIKFCTFALYESITSDEQNEKLPVLS